MKQTHLSVVKTEVTADEWQTMCMHTRIGAQILGASDSPVMQASETVAETHHEKVDGRGYPRGTKGDSIPMFGRIVALRDAFDAITSSRCYKEAEPIDAGLEIVKTDEGSHFDPECVAALERGFDDAIQIHRQFASDDGESAA